jgi:hypothetical protein
MPPFFNGLRRDNEDSDEGGSGDDSRDWKGIRKANLKDLEKHERKHQRRKQHQEEIRAQLKEAEIARGDAELREAQLRQALAEMDTEDEEDEEVRTRTGSEGNHESNSDIEMDNGKGVSQ